MLLGRALLWLLLWLSPQCPRMRTCGGPALLQSPLECPGSHIAQKQLQQSWRGAVGAQVGGKASAKENPKGSCCLLLDNHKAQLASPHCLGSGCTPCAGSEVSPHSPCMEPSLQCLYQIPGFWSLSLQRAGPDMLQPHCINEPSPTSLPHHFQLVPMPEGWQCPGWDGSREVPAASPLP